MNRKSIKQVIGIDGLRWIRAFKLKGNDGLALKKSDSLFLGKYKFVNNIVAGIDVGIVYYFKINDSAPIWSYDIGGSSMYDLEISSDGKYIVASGTNGGLSVLSNNSSTPLWIKEEGLTYFDLALSSDGKYIVGGSSLEHITFFERTSSTPAHS